jgi:uncharacterized membrane protein YphA (DoxX/SURF4 family)
MEYGLLLTGIESALRIVLGLRFLSSGVSNIRRWPHAIESARIVFPRGAPFFGFVATALMTLGGLGLTVGFATQISALLIVIFLIPTFEIQRHWLQTLPLLVGEVQDTTLREDLKPKMQLLGKHAIHAHEVGWQNNLVLLLLGLFFFLRRDVAFGLDNLLGGDVLRLF